MPAQRIAIYGKGGIGKSTVATNLSVLFAQAGLRVLHVGCDPKRDSSLKLLDGPAPASALESLATQGVGVKASDLLSVGRHGVEFLEAGGPEPGAGCAGRGVSLMIEQLENLQVLQQGNYDVVVYDVLGDVVCGGFAAPLRRGMAQTVCIVTSEEPMSLYAANNIAKAVLRYSRNGVVLGGLIVNLRDPGIPLPPLELFAERLSTTVLAVLERDRQIQQAEVLFRTVVETAPEAPSSRVLRELASRLRTQQSSTPRPPTPLEPEEFRIFVREHLAGVRPEPLPEGSSR